MSSVKGMGGGRMGVFEGKVEHNRITTPGAILITKMTDPGMLPDILKASAVVTDEGGSLCHAALVCMELGIPFVVGTKAATKTFAEGEFVSVNTETGKVELIVH